MDFRISTSYQFGTYSRDIARAEQHAFDAQQAVTTGKRINNLRDDPLGVARTLNLHSLKSGVAQYTSNLNLAKGFLGSTDSALSETKDLVGRAYELAVSGANGATDQAGRNAMATEITQI